MSKNHLAKIKDLSSSPSTRARGSLKSRKKKSFPGSPSKLKLLCLFIARQRRVWLSKVEFILVITLFSMIPFASFGTMWAYWVALYGYFLVVVLLNVVAYWDMIKPTLDSMVYSTELYMTKGKGFNNKYVKNKGKQ